MNKLRAPTKNERKALAAIIRIASSAIAMMEDEKERKEGFLTKKCLLKYHQTSRKFIASQYNEFYMMQPDFYLGALEGD